MTEKVISRLFQLEGDITWDTASLHLIELLECAERECFEPPVHISTNVAVIILNFNSMASSFHFKAENNPGLSMRYRKIREFTIKEIDSKIETQTGGNQKYWQSIREVNMEIMNWDQC